MLFTLIEMAGWGGVGVRARVGLWLRVVRLRTSRCRAKEAEGKGAASSCALCTVRAGSFRSSPQLTGTGCAAWEGAGTAPSRSWRHLRSPWL